MMRAALLNDTRQSNSDEPDGDDKPNHASGTPCMQISREPAPPLQRQCGKFGRLIRLMP